MTSRYGYLFCHGLFTVLNTRQPPVTRLPLLKFTEKKTPAISLATTRSSQRSPLVHYHHLNDSGLTLPPSRSPLWNRQDASD